MGFKRRSELFASSENYSCGLIPVISDSDYTIFSWRQQSYVNGLLSPNMNDASPAIPAIEVGEGHRSQLSVASTVIPSPTLYLHSPNKPLPVPPAYRNPSYYAFRPTSIVERTPSVSSSVEKSSRRSSHKKEKEAQVQDGVPKLMKQFQKFHNENGVRTVMGSIGPVKNGKYIPLPKVGVDVRLTIVHSQDAFEGRLSSCLYFEEIRAEPWLHTPRCHPRTLRIRWSGQHRHMANHTGDLEFA